MEKMRRILAVFVCGFVFLMGFGITHAEELLTESETIATVTIPPEEEKVPDYVPHQLLVKFLPEVEIHAGVIPDWLIDLGVLRMEVIFPGAPSPKEIKLKKIRELLEARKKLVREYTQGIKTNKFSFEKLSEFLSALRYLNKELSRIARSKPEKEFVDLRNSWKLVFKKDVDILDMADKLEDDNRVIYAETNGIAEAHFIPPDSSFDQQWALHNTGQTGGKDDADIDAPEAWDIETGVSTILIAVIDSGVDWNHPDLDANVWLNLGEDSNGNGILEGENFDDYGTDGIPSHQEPGYDPDTNPDPNQDNYNDGRGPDEDPFFVDPAADDYHLQIGSQCIDTGDPDPAYNDPDSTRNDMGTYGGPGAIVSPPP